MFRLVCLMVFCGFVLVHCKVKQEFHFPEEDKVDSVLVKLIESKSKTGSINEFILPDEDQWDKIPQDSTNPITKAKVELGQKLFFDPAISFNPKCEAAAGTFSCATCHFADAGFSAGIHQAIAGGGRGFGHLRHKHPLCDSSLLDVQMIKTPSIVNCAYQEVMLWSGKFGCCGPNKGTDSLWPPGSFIELNKLGMSGVETQARVALEAHGMRMSPKLVTQTEYKPLFDSAYPKEREDLRYLRFTMARAIGAYERTVIANKAPFQKWIRGEEGSMSYNQKKGAILFFGKGNCVQCHRGPALNSMAFYALGMNEMEGPDVVTKQDSFTNVHLGRGALTKRKEDEYCFKVPQLYNLKDHQYYGHGAGFCSIEEVIKYKNLAIAENLKVPKSNLAKEFIPLNLTETEIKLLVDFLENALYDLDLKRYNPTTVPSGLCFPNADRLSRIQLACSDSTKLK
ncbi:MAG TPA: cytochrome c peroxidase [Saprospiraceae bacterium]|nr:cytochrome c peroxidase [Saprospiraceae bacterium]